MSDYPVTFHYMSTDDMYQMEYFVYHVRPYGIINQPQDLNIKVLYNQVEQNEITDYKVNQQGDDNENQQVNDNKNQEGNDAENLPAEVSDQKEVPNDIKKVEEKVDEKVGIKVDEGIDDKENMV